MSRDDDIIKAYVEDELTAPEVGARFGLTGARVHQIVTRAGVARSKAETGEMLHNRRKQELESRIDELVALYHELGSVSRVARRVKVGPPLIQEVLGPHLTAGVRRSAAAQRTAEPTFSDEALRKDLRTAQKQIGDAYLSIVRYTKVAEELGLASEQTQQKRFGSWGKALAEVGLTGVTRSNGFGRKLYTDEDMTAALSRVTELVGRFPSIPQYDEHRDATDPSAAAIRARFRTWSAAHERIMT